MSAVLKSVPSPKRQRTVNVETETYVSVDVDIPLSEIPTEDLIEELAERDGHMPPSLQAIYELMAAGRKDDAYEMMRQHIMDVTGRILP